MRKHRRSATLAGLVMVLCLAGIGGAYALWFQVLTFAGTVNTGNLDVVWTVEHCLENEDADEAGPFDDGFVWLPKEVASFVRGPIPEGHEIGLTISNAYPGYAVDCKLDFKNVGTIPVHVEREYIDIDTDGNGSFDDPGDLHFECLANVNQPDCFNVDYNVDPWQSTANPAPVYVRWVNGLGCQLHSNDRASGDLFIGIRQPAAENATYNIRFRVQFNQYNESVWTNCATPRVPQPSIPVPPSGQTSNP